MNILLFGPGLDAPAFFLKNLLTIPHSYMKCSARYIKSFMKKKDSDFDFVLIIKFTTGKGSRFHFLLF